MNDEALKLLGERGNSDDSIFLLYPKVKNITGNTLKKWCREVGIEKPVTFHSSRHTFAVMMLSEGVPIFTVQKLMGHANIQSTMQYADIVDKTKDEAIILKMPSVL